MSKVITVDFDETLAVTSSTAWGGSTLIPVERIVNFVKSKIDSVSDSEKEDLIMEILDTYDIKDPKIKELLRKYERYLKKFQSEVKSEKVKIGLVG
jgi:hypothetical protein